MLFRPVSCVPLSIGSLVGSQPVDVMNTSRSSITGMPTQKINYLPLGDTEPDAYQIIANLNAMVEMFAQVPYVRESTVKVARDNFIGNNELARIITALTYFVKDKVIYVPDPMNSEYVISPVVMLETIARDGKAYGDCDDHVLLLASMAMSVGIPSHVVGVKINGSKLFNHVIVSVIVDGKLVDIDPCAKEVDQPVYAERLV